jgi:hypothetical protein
MMVFRLRSNFPFWNSFTAIHSQILDNLAGGHKFPGKFYFGCMRLYRPDNVWRVGLSYLGCRCFYEGAQAQAQ